MLAFSEIENKWKPNLIEKADPVIDACKPDNKTVQDCKNDERE